MVLEGFQEDDNGHLVSEVGEADEAVLLRVGLLGDTISLEQQSGTGPVDLITLWSREEARRLAQLLQSWADAQ